MGNLSLANFDNYAGYLSALVTTGTPTDASFMREFYRMLAAYERNNGLFDYIYNDLKSVRVRNQDLKPIRNPANRTVEFYAAKLWPGKLPDALPIEADNEAIIPLILRLWEWSNWNSRKQRMARWFATYGDIFIKINTRGTPPTSVYLHLVKPEYVTDLELDERGFVSYLRMDVPDGDNMWTEVWDKRAGTQRVWQHDQGWDVSLDRIQQQPTVTSIGQATGDDFIPVVYQPFKDDGEGRGGGAFTHVLDKIDEANRQATRLHQMLYRHNKPLWALLANGMDTNGRPLPAPSVSDALNSDSELSLDDNDILSLPGATDMKSLVPAINYADALAVLEAQMAELRADLPELAYYDIRDMNEVSGRAVRLMLDDAISRLLEARGNAESALSRANEMALTVGQNVGLFPKDIGTYRDGAFAHSFSDRPILPLDKLEQATIATTLAGTYDKEQAAIEAGFSEESAGKLVPDEPEPQPVIMATETPEIQEQNGQ